MLFPKRAEAQREKEDKPGDGYKAWKRVHPLERTKFFPSLSIFEINKIHAYETILYESVRVLRTDSPFRSMNFTSGDRFGDSISNNSKPPSDQDSYLLRSEDE